MRISIITTLLLAACSSGHELAPATGGEPAEGRVLVRRFGCNACHAIPGVRGFGGGVGPPLGHFAMRGFIAGTVPNTPTNLVRWIRDPRGVEAHTAMPTLGLTEQEARDVAAYLYTLD